MEYGLAAAFEKREKLTLRLISALSHKSHEEMIFIITSFIPLNELEEIVEFQER